MNHLTETELAAMDTTATLAGQLTELVGSGPTRSQDLGEVIHHLHAIQHFIMAQAAARAYPHRFRLAGETIRQRDKSRVSRNDYLG